MACAGFFHIRAMVSKAQFLYKALANWLFKANSRLSNTSEKYSSHYFSICNIGIIQ